MPESSATAIAAGNVELMQAVSSLKNAILDRWREIIAERVKDLAESERAAALERMGYRDSEHLAEVFQGHRMSFETFVTYAAILGLGLNDLMS